ncbi:MAG: mechanosensitive ion channel family protein [Robiginitomaculum sp.]
MAQDTQTPTEAAASSGFNLDFSAEGMAQLGQSLLEKAVVYVPKIIIAGVILWVGSHIARRAFNLVQGQAQNNPRIDTTIGKLAATIVRYAIFITALLIAVSILGVNVAAIMGVFAAMTLAIGLALQGSMSNVAAGFLLILLRPYKIGDYVEVAGQEGTVEDVNIFTTTLRTVDNVQVIISNGEVRGSTIKNLSSLGKRRIDVDFGIDYGDDIDKAIGIIKDVAVANPDVLKDSPPWAKVSCLNDSSVDIQMRVWCKSADYWDTRFDLIKSVKEAFDAGGISIPYPHVVEIER